MSRQVTVYTTPFCASCEQLKAWLAARGVAFSVRDLLIDEEAGERMDMAGIRSTPVLEVDGELHAGPELAPGNLVVLLEL
jgi:glutaredoxin